MTLQKFCENLNFIVLIVSIVLYFTLSVTNSILKNYPHAGIWFGYTLSNCMFLWDYINKTK